MSKAIICIQCLCSNVSFCDKIPNLTNKHIQMLACFKSFFAFLELIIYSNPVPFSETSLKKAPGNKIPAATPHPGKNGTPTFAAVAAGYDKSPGKY